MPARRASGPHSGPALNGRSFSLTRVVLQIPATLEGGAGRHEASGSARSMGRNSGGWLVRWKSAEVGFLARLPLRCDGGGRRGGGYGGHATEAGEEPAAALGG